ncbi:fructosamine kinase family protein [Thalassobacillus devorans]|uniref:fructosamine kinase family protein n=1 Tax=Thalassobacillus devorans TaxID=279813 RepID=UPI0004B1B21E|nr:fructosamine kinase family protein [Thalassobacillus devorans]
MNHTIQNALHNLGDHSPVEAIRQVAGGDINEAYHITTRENSYFIKTNEGIPTHFFEVEAKGLELIRNTNTIRVPYVYYFDRPENGTAGAIVMEWISGAPQNDTPARLGRKLGAMHQVENERYGLKGESFVGTLAQPNGWFGDWLSYYQKQRLLPQLELAARQGLMNHERRSKMEQLIAQLDEWIPKHPGASLLHGDLWGGNWMAGPDGEPCLIDPSVVYGDRSFELAFTELFGGFPKQFYEAYEDIHPFPPHYHDTKAIYQLFYLLVHLNLFGESYGRPVDRILTAYIG